MIGSNLACSQCQVLIPKSLHVYVSLVQNPTGDPLYPNTLTTIQDFGAEEQRVCMWGGGGEELDKHQRRM